MSAVTNQPQIPQPVPSQRQSFVGENKASKKLEQPDVASKAKDTRADLINRAFQMTLELKSDIEAYLKEELEQAAKAVDPGPQFGSAPSAHHVNDKGDKVGRAESQQVTTETINLGDGEVEIVEENQNGEAFSTQFVQEGDPTQLKTTGLDSNNNLYLGKVMSQLQSIIDLLKQTGLVTQNKSLLSSVNPKTGDHKDFL